MSLAAAIIISTLLAIGAWQIDKRGGWRRSIKVIVIGAAILAVFGAVLGGYLFWESNRDQWGAQREAQEIRSGSLAKYLGIGLGDSTTQVLYLMGKPPITRPAEEWQPNSNYPKEYWYYPNDPVSRQERMLSRAQASIVAFHETGVVLSVSCAGEFRASCPSIAGISIGDSEADILTAFGSLQYPDHIDDTGMKTICFGKIYSVRFWLREMHLRKIALSSAPCDQSLLDSPGVVAPQDTPGA